MKKNNPTKFWMILEHFRSEGWKSVPLWVVAEVYQWWDVPSGIKSPDVSGDPKRTVSLGRDHRAHILRESLHRGLFRRRYNRQIVSCN